MILHYRCMFAVNVVHTRTGHSERVQMEWQNEIEREYCCKCLIQSHHMNTLLPNHVFLYVSRRNIEWTLHASWLSLSLRLCLCVSGLFIGSVMIFQFYFGASFCLFFCSFSSFVLLVVVSFVPISLHVICMVQYLKINLWALICGTAGWLAGCFKRCTRLCSKFYIIFSSANLLWRFSSQLLHPIIIHVCCVLLFFSLLFLFLLTVVDRLVGRLDGFCNVVRKISISNRECLAFIV